jgi:hypothetical protein
MVGGPWRLQLQGCWVRVLAGQPGGLQLYSAYTVCIFSSLSAICASRHQMFNSVSEYECRCELRCNSASNIMTARDPFGPSLY